MKDKKKSSIGIDQNVAAALTYTLGPITGIFFFVNEKESEFVKFHALQSLVTFGIIWILFPFWVVFSVLLFPLVVIFSLFLIFKAYKGEKYKLPGIGYLAEKQVEKNM